MKRICRLLTFLACFASAATAVAATQKFDAFLDGTSASPPNNSPATGVAEVFYDDVAHTLSVDIQFNNLSGYASAAHIHAPTPTPYSGVSLPATTVPSFVGFPTNENTGDYRIDLDLTQESSYNPTFDGGTPASQEVALMAAIEQGRAYVTIHTSVVPSGEIVGFLISLPGDYNLDGFVDAADYTIWRHTFGQMGISLAADGDNSNAIDDTDYTTWRQNFGHSRNDFTAGGGHGASVPEPGAMFLLSAACVALLIGWRR